MKIKTFSPIPDFMLERLVAFQEPFNGKSWEDMYEAIATLKKNYPEGKFKAQPYIYIDLESKSNGFIFVDSDTEQLFYVYK
jgi:hypothetical protein